MRENVLPQLHYVKDTDVIVHLLISLCDEAHDVHETHTLVLAPSICAHSRASRAEPLACKQARLIQDLNPHIQHDASRHMISVPSSPV